MCLFLGLLRAPNVEASYAVPQSFSEKLHFGEDLMETFDSPSFSAVRFKREISLNRAAIDRRRLVTIFNHFRDKPARQTECVNKALVHPQVKLKLSGTCRR